MLTKIQKKEHVEMSSAKIKANKNVVFADFTGVATADVNHLKKELKKAGAEFKVVKKRLLKIALKEAGITFDPSSVKAPIATIFIPQELTTVASAIYKFSKDLAKRKIEFKVLAAFDREKNALLTGQEFTIIAKLPSREVLLAQILGGITGPLRAFMNLVEQIAKSKSQMAKPETVTAAAAPTSATPTAEQPKVETK